MPGSIFAEAFRRHVRPALCEAVADQAALGVSFQEAVAEVMSLAIARGAGCLSGDHYDALIDWVEASIIEAQEAWTLIQRVIREPDRNIIRQEVRSFIGLTDG